MEKVEIDFRKSAQENAQKYFDDAKWAKKKADAAKAAAEPLRKKLEAEAKKERPESKPEKREKLAWFEKFRWLRTTAGLLAVGGRDATQNEILFRKHLEKDDIVLHAEIPGAPFTILKSEGKEIKESDIMEAATLAACYSSAWKSGLGSVDVYWAHSDKVSKTPKPGEFVGKGAFIFHERNFLKRVKLELSIGFLNGKIVAEHPGSARAAPRALIVPGKLGQSELAKKIKHRLKAEVPLEDIQKLIPAGGGFVGGKERSH